MIFRETASYPLLALLSDLGGAGGLVIGLNMIVLVKWGIQTLDQKLTLA